MHPSSHISFYLSAGFEKRGRSRITWLLGTRTANLETTRVHILEQASEAARSGIGQNRNFCNTSSRETGVRSAHRPGSQRGYPSYGGVAPTFLQDERYKTFSFVHNRALNIERCAKQLRCQSPIRCFGAFRLFSYFRFFITAWLRCGVEAAGADSAPSSRSTRHRARYKPRCAVAHLLLTSARNGDKVGSSFYRGAPVGLA